MAHIIMKGVGIKSHVHCGLWDVHKAQNGPKNPTKYGLWAQEPYNISPQSLRVMLMDLGSRDASHFLGWGFGISGCSSKAPELRDGIGTSQRVYGVT